VKAAQAFRYIEQYAANLINQPWRQEYRTIRQAARILSANLLISVASKSAFLSLPKLEKFRK
jgi:hypothetical protein